MSDESGGSLRTEGTLIGLSASATGGWHIHAGHTCESSSTTPSGISIGGHYYDVLSTPDDPWKAEFGVYSRG